MRLDTEPEARRDGGSSRSPLPRLRSGWPRSLSALSGKPKHRGILCGWLRPKTPKSLWRQFSTNKDDKALRDRLILTYAPLVKYVAGRLGSGLPAHVDEG